MDKVSKSFNIPRLLVALSGSAYFVYYIFSYKEWHFIDNINLIFHEAGHIIFMMCGTFMHILGGSLLQILIPIIFVTYFYLKEHYFSASLLLFWVGQNIINVSVYASDAIRMELPLLGGDGVGHDWNALLDMTHLLKYTYKIGTGLFVLGIIVIIYAVCLSIKTSQDKVHDSF